MTRIAVYTGSFDPITLGHLNVIERGSRFANQLIVGVGTNIEKQPLFSVTERVELVRTVTNGLGNVEVRPFTGLAVQFVHDCGAQVIIRGIRTLSDMEHEFTMALTNRKLDPAIETVFLMADEQYSHVSSSLIRQIAALANDEELSQFVPSEIISCIRTKLRDQMRSSDMPQSG
ncbi:MAG: pantetheine-phosphate adenylyltransferase [Pirellulales bacterium]|nr:pantetheine-phosphate adenylyltransferase [Pirellulales bacterium]